MRAGFFGRTPWSTPGRPSRPTGVRSSWHGGTGCTCAAWVARSRGPGCGTDPAGVAGRTVPHTARSRASVCAPLGIPRRRARGASGGTGTSAGGGDNRGRHASRGARRVPGRGPRAWSSRRSTGLLLEPQPHHGLDDEGDRDDAGEDGGASEKLDDERSHVSCRGPSGAPRPGPERRRCGSRSPWDISPPRPSSGLRAPTSIRRPTRRLRCRA